MHLYQFILVQNGDLNCSLNYFQSSINLSSVGNLTVHFSLIPTNNIKYFNIWHFCTLYSLFDQMSITQIQLEGSKLYRITLKDWIVAKWTRQIFLVMVQFTHYFRIFLYVMLLKSGYHETRNTSHVNAGVYSTFTQNHTTISAVYECQFMSLA